jgi:hypothetical protein
MLLFHIQPFLNNIPALPPRPIKFYENCIDKILLVDSLLSIIVRSSGIVFLIRSYLIIDRLDREINEKLLMEACGKQEIVLAVDSLSTSENEIESVNSNTLDKTHVKPFSQEYYKQILK